MPIIFKKLNSFTFLNVCVYMTAFELVRAVAPVHKASRDALNDNCDKAILQEHAPKRLLRVRLSSLPPAGRKLPPLFMKLAGHFELVTGGQSLAQIA